MIARLRKALFDDVRTKAMAALMAGILWFYVNVEYGEESPQLTARVAVAVPEDILVLRIDDPSGREVDEVSVILKGTKGNVRNLAPRDLVCRPRVPLPEKGLEGKEIALVQLSEKDFDLPPMLRASIAPPALRITLAPAMEQVLRIRTTDCTFGRPEEGFRVAKVEVTPTQVRVRGPRHLLRGRTEISITKVDVSQARDSFTQKSHVQPVLEADGEVAKLECADTVTVGVTLEEDPVEVTVTGKVYVLLPANFPHKFEPRPAEVGVVVRVPSSEAAKVNEKNLVIIADPLELYSDPAGQMQPGGTFKVPLRVRAREGGPKNVQLVKALQEFTLYLPSDEK